MLYLVFGSIAIGLLIGRLIHLVELKIVDAAIEITISLIAPYVAYLAAESLRASGVMATVACGLYLGHKSSLYLSRGARLTGTAVWDTLTFVLNGFVFLLIGFQLPYILYGIRGSPSAGALASGSLVQRRGDPSAPDLDLSGRVRYRISFVVAFFTSMKRLPSRSAIFIVGWTGMRGVVALAAAISLPEMLDSGDPFPERNVMIFLTFCVIFVTLVLQGLTLPPLIRRLGLSGFSGQNAEEDEARRAMIEAALAYLEQGREDAPGEFAPVYDELISDSSPAPERAEQRQIRRNWISPRGLRALERSFAAGRLNPARHRFFISAIRTRSTTK